MSIEDPNQTGVDVAPLPEPTRPVRESGNAPEGEPVNRWATPAAERPPTRKEMGMVSNPDF